MMKVMKMMASRKTSILTLTLVQYVQNLTSAGDSEATGTASFNHAGMVSTRARTYTHTHPAVQTCATLWVRPSMDLFC